MFTLEEGNRWQPRVVKLDRLGVINRLDARQNVQAFVETAQVRSVALRAQIAQGAPKVFGQSLRLLGDYFARPRQRAAKPAGQAGLGGCNTQGVSIHMSRRADAAHLLQYRALGQQRHKGIGLDRQGRVQGQHGIDEAAAGAMRHGQIHVQLVTPGVLRQRLFEHRQSALVIARAQSALRAGDRGVDLGRVSHGACCRIRPRARQYPAGRAAR